MALTGAERIAAFALDMAAAPLPEALREAARLHLLDALGVGLAAATVSGPDGWAAAAIPGDAPLLSGGTAEPGSAAMINGALIHALEYDDTHIGAIVHGSAIAAPVALAQGAVPGMAVLCAYATVWEVAVALGLSAPGRFQARGFQATSVGGAVGAAAAMAAGMGLSRRQVISAVGIAAGQASGTLAFLSEGASCKALNPGWAARIGIEAARLAAAGMTGPADAIEGRFGAFEAFAGQEGTTMGALGETWYLPDAAFKLWPCCHYIHPFLEAVEDLTAQGITADTIRSVVLEGPPPVAPLIAEPWARRQAPASGYDGKWGLAYCVALMMLDGRVDVDSFETAPRRDAIALARRMDWRGMADHGFPGRFAGRVTAQTARGPLRAERRQVLGAPERPVASGAILRKYRDNAARRLPAARVAALETAVLTLDGSPDCAALRRALVG